MTLLTGRSDASHRPGLVALKIAYLRFFLCRDNLSASDRGFRSSVGCARCFAHHSICVVLLKMVRKKSSAPYDAFDFELFPIRQADEGVIFVGLPARTV